MPKQSKQNNILQFKITLNDSEPKVWRRILVPDNYTFFDLHCAIQDAFGWFDYHLHAFYIHVHGKEMKDRISIEFPDPEREPIFDEDLRDERKEKIDNYFGKLIKQCTYCYDFGDSWDHTILFEREISANLKEHYPQCIAGYNACPPEDCGGVWGYKDLQKILKNPKHPEHQNMMEWLLLEDPKDFDPSQFEVSEVEFANPKRVLKEWNKGFGVR